METTVWITDRFKISIHAPREGGDISPEEMEPFTVYDISIHAPREGGDGLLMVINHLREHFNPRPPRGGRLPCG